MASVYLIKFYLFIMYKCLLSVSVIYSHATPTHHVHIQTVFGNWQAICSISGASSQKSCCLYLDQVIFNVRKIKVTGENAPLLTPQAMLEYRQVYSISHKNQYFRNTSLTSQVVLASEELPGILQKHMLTS